MTNRQNAPTANPQPTIFHRGKWYVLPAADALAGKQINRGNLKEAEEICQALLSKFPYYFPARYRLSFICLKAGKVDEALTHCEEALALEPENFEAHFRRGAILQALTRYEDALATYDRCIALKPDHTEAHLLRSLMLKYLRRFDQALASSETALRLQPKLPAAYCHRGHLFVVKGEMEEAEKMFRHAVTLNPNYAEAWAALAGIRKYREVDHDDIKAIQAVIRQPGIPPAEKQSLLFALGKIHDDCAQYDAAFEYFQEANELRKRDFSYDALATTEKTDAIIEVFSKEFVSSPFSFSSTSSLPIFVVGMPRSGTTLIANILSNHPLIATAGEVLDVDAFSLRLGKLNERETNYPEAVRNISFSLASQFIDDYLEKLCQIGGVGARYVIDKYPLNFRHLGLITQLFPQARIIHCVRHPLDTSLSTYFQPFSLFYRYSSDLQNIAHFYQEYLRLMQHWRNALPPARMLEINYEEMVRDTEKGARTALSWLGLEWDERCLTPHTNRAGVETFSRWQVRQPINDQSIGRWRHYKNHLGPLEKLASSWSSKPGADFRG